MEIKLIASDMDGTLLDKQKHISERTIKAIKKAIALGKIFVLATGRMYISAKPYAEQLGLDVPIVTYNGALVCGSKSRKVYFEHKVALATAQKVLDFCKEKGYYLHYYVNDECCVEKHTAFTEKYETIQNIHLTDLGDKLYEAQAAPYKILLCADPAEQPHIMEEIQKRFSEVLHITSSHPVFVELTDPAVDKWAALKSLAALYNIKPEEIMCIGDSLNDYEMVANAGLGVAMGNAVDEVKDVAKMITASNINDGVALAIESVCTPQAKE